MSVHFEKGDLLEADIDFICHQVNTFGVMGGGLAAQIAKKYPNVEKAYQMFCSLHSSSPLGRIQMVMAPDLKMVVNIFSQVEWVATDYDALRVALGTLATKAPEGSKIGFPDHYGCGIANGDWEIVLNIITEVLGDKFEVYIYKREG